MPLPSALPKPGQTFGPYLIEGVLGQGGMGAVYRARHHETGAVHALKVIRTDRLLSGKDDALVARFRREAELMARVEAHPGIVRVHGTGVEAGLPWLALEMVGGQSLHQRLEQGPVDAGEAAVLVAQAARAVQHAHDCGVIHRDIKPHNLLIDSGGTVRVVDFGIAHDALGSRLTATGDVLGTPDYLAPEQLDVRSSEEGPLPLSIDVYALGGVLYATLTGQPPFSNAESPQDLMVSILHREPLPPSARNAAVPADLEAVTLKCLRKDPAHRYTTVSDLADELDRFARGLPILTTEPSATGRLWLRWRFSSRGVRLATLAVAFAVLCGLAAVSVWSTRRVVARRSRRELALLSAKVEQGGVFSPSLRETLVRLAEQPDLVADDRLGQQLALLQLLSKLDEPGADTRGTALAIARLVRPAGQIHEPLLTLAERTLVASSRLTTLHHVLYGVGPEAMAPLRVAGDLAQHIIESDGSLHLPRDRPIFAALLKAPGITPQVSGRLLVLRGSDLLEMGPEMYDQALSCFLDAWEAHPVPLDNTSWPREFYEHVAGRFLDGFLTNGAQAAKLVRILASLPRDLPPLTTEDFGRAVQALNDEAAPLRGGTNIMSEQQLDTLLLLASFLECHGRSLAYGQRARTLQEALGFRRLVDLIAGFMKQNDPRLVDPARLLVLARIVASGSIPADILPDRASLLREMVDLAVRTADSQRWLLAGAALLFTSCDEHDKARKWAHAALLVDRKLPEVERWPVIPLLCSQVTPHATEETQAVTLLGQKARFLVEASKLQSLHSDDLNPHVVRPWPFNRALQISEEIVVLTRELILHRPEFCCVQLSDGLSANVLLEHAQQVVEWVPPSLFRRKLDRVVGDILRLSGHHHFRHGRLEQAEQALKEAIRRYQVVLRYKAEGQSLDGVEQASAELERVRAALEDSPR